MCVLVWVSLGANEDFSRYNSVYFTSSSFLCLRCLSCFFFFWSLRSFLWSAGRKKKIKCLPRSRWRMWRCTAGTSSFRVAWPTLHVVSPTGVMAKTLLWRRRWHNTTSAKPTVPPRRSDKSCTSYWPLLSSPRPAAAATRAGPLWRAQAFLTNRMGWRTSPRTAPSPPPQWWSWKACRHRRYRRTRKRRHPCPRSRCARLCSRRATVRMRRRWRVLWRWFFSAVRCCVRHAIKVCADVHVHMCVRTFSWGNFNTISRSCGQEREKAVFFFSFICWF